MSMRPASCRWIWFRVWPKGGWEFYVNGKSLNLDKKYNWELRGNILSIDIPIKYLKTEEENEICLISTKKYKKKYGKNPYSYRIPDALNFWIYPDILGLEKPW